MISEYKCVVCKKKFSFQNTNEIKNNKKEKMKHFCCNDCLNTEHGQTYLKLKSLKTKLIHNLIFLAFSILGILMYIYIIIYFTR